MRVQAPRAVGDLLPAAMPQLGERLLEYKIQTSWTSIVGPDVARRARASAMSGGTLEILVDNSPWLHELTLRSDDLLRRVRERFPEISAVKFALSTAPVAPSSRERTGVPRPERTALTPSDLAEIDLAVSVIPDPTIADAARRLLTTARRSPLSRSLRIALLTVALPLFAACATARPAVTPVATDAPERSVPAAPDVRAEAYYHYAVAQTYALAGRFKEATAEIQEAISQDPNSAYLWTQLAQWLARADAPDDAVAAARRAVALSPTDAASHVALAEMLRSQKKFAEAEAELEKVIALNPNAEEVYLMLSRYHVE